MLPHRELSVEVRDGTLAVPLKSDQVWQDSPPGLQVHRDCRRLNQWHVELLLTRPRINHQCRTHQMDDFVVVRAKFVGMRECLETACEVAGFDELESKSVKVIYRTVRHCRFDPSSLLILDSQRRASQLGRPNELHSSPDSDCLPSTGIS